MKLIKCKACGGEVAKSAKQCPHCGAKLKRSAGQIFLGLILSIIGLSLIVSAFGGNSSGSQARDSGSSATVDLVSLENFEKINTSMSYEDVCDLFGAEGTMLSEVDIGDDEYTTQMYYWYDSTGIANCNVTFQGGYMTAKAQVGLK